MVFFLFLVYLQGTRMEERLDDALNVLRNHCEPQLGIQMDSSYVGSSPVVNTPGASDNVTNEPTATVKLERGSLNTSEFCCNIFFIVS